MSNTMISEAAPAAWLHEDDSDRVISAAQKATAIRDGGASASSVKPYTVAAYTHPQPAELAVDVEEMLTACVPGGSIVDPQVVADNIRAWFADRKPAELAEQQALHRSALMHALSDAFSAGAEGLQFAGDARCDALLDALAAAGKQQGMDEQWIGEDGPQAVWIFLDAATNVTGYSETGPNLARPGERAVKFVRAATGKQQVGEVQGDALVRYGRAGEGSQWLLEPMADGYWTPWHVAAAALAAHQPGASNQSSGNAGGLVFDGQPGAQACTNCDRTDAQVICQTCAGVAWDDGRLHEFNETRELTTSLGEGALDDLLPDAWHEKPLLRFQGAYDCGDDSAGVPARSGHVLASDQAGTVLGDYLADRAAKGGGQ